MCDFGVCAGFILQNEVFYLVRENSWWESGVPSLKIWLGFSLGGREQDCVIKISDIYA